MTTERKIRANRANARLSTGPRTPQGKARSSRSALRHGLSIAVVAGSGPFAEEIEKLARKITGGMRSKILLEHARRVAMTRVDLGRIRLVRYELLSHVFPDEFSGREALHHFENGQLRKQLRRLEKLERYELRALSRRRLAIKAFD